MRGLLAGLLLATSAAHAAPVANALQARDINNDGTVDAYYDGDLNITWLADASAGGWQSQGSALAWVSSLNVYGVTGWHLASNGPLPQFCIDALNEGGVSCSYRADPAVSQLAHMLQVTLGNSSPKDGGPPDNAGPFTGLLTDHYFGLESFRGEFTGASIAYNSATGWIEVSEEQFDWLGWAVRDGDIQAADPPAVPEPGAWLLALIGLGCVSAVAARRS